MIKKFKLYIILIAMAVSSASCLDKMPEDGIPFDKSLQTVSDINLAVIGIYDAFRSNYLYSGNLTLLPDIQTDLVYSTARTPYGKRPPTTRTSTSWTNVAERLTLPAHLPTRNW